MKFHPGLDGRLHEDGVEDGPSGGVVGVDPKVVDHWKGNALGTEDEVDPADRRRAGRDDAIEDSRPAQLENTRADQRVG